jgi:hypothetical protein
MAHVKNVEAFEKLKGICTGYGGAYNPGQQNLQVDALNTLFINAEQAIYKVMEAQTVYNNVTNTRELIFKKVRSLASDVCSVLSASGANELTMNDARSICRKIRGYSLSKRKPDPDSANGTDNSKSVSVYGTDYASLVSHFARLVELIESMPDYQPNEPRLTLEGLQQVVAQLRAANQAVIQAYTNLVFARRHRNELLYTGAQNLVRTAKAAKEYVRGVFGYRSSQHIEVTRLRFTKPRV